MQTFSAVRQPHPPEHLVPILLDEVHSPTRYLYVGADLLDGSVVALRRALTTLVKLVPVVHVHANNTVSYGRCTLDWIGGLGGGGGGGLLQ